MLQKYTLTDLHPILRWLLLPLSGLHGLALWGRHKLYDIGCLPSATGPLPTVALGNLTVGGTGKTPHALLVLRHLEAEWGVGRVALLSRGYGRKTRGFREVDVADLAAHVGDEPLMMKRRRPEVLVAVCEDRLLGLNQIHAAHPAIRLVLLDDALQHRRLIPTVRLLLVDATQPMGRDALLPAGRLRDLRSRAATADACIVTRWPEGEALRPEDRQRLGVPLSMPAFCSVMVTDDPVPAFGDGGAPAHSLRRVVAIAGVARPQRFFEEVAEKMDLACSMAYPDHHNFETADFERWIQAVKHFKADGLITTEKDLARLTEADIVNFPVPVLVLRIEAQWNDERSFHSWLSRTLAQTIHREMAENEDI